MRWKTAGLCALSLVVMTGCDDGFTKGGRIDRTVHQDVLESLRKACSREDAQKYCAQGKEKSRECLEKCGPR